MAAKAPGLRPYIYAPDVLRLCLDSFFRPLQLFATDSMFVTTIIVILGIFLSKSSSHLPMNRAGDS